jgi:hypothetical protein
MDPQAFDRLIKAQSEAGAAAVFAEAIRASVAEQNFHRTFELLLLQARYDLELPLFGMGPASLLPEDLADRYEARVMEAGRKVRDYFLDQGDLISAFQYAKMIDETEPIHRALEQIQPDDNTVDSLIEIAVSHNVHPARGLHWIIERYGTCQGITTVEQLLSQGIKPPQRDECIKVLIRQLHAELLARLQEEVEAKEGRAPSSLPLLMAGRDWLFAGDAYHIDTSHLNAVVRMARVLPRCDELNLVIHLCEYGCRLSPRHAYPEGAPFEELYPATIRFLNVIMGVDVDAGLAYFRKRAEAVRVDDADLYPVEVYVSLLLAVGQTESAVLLAVRKMTRNDYRPSLMPGYNELCQQLGMFREMTNWARKRGDLLGFVAGLVQQAEG